MKSHSQNIISLLDFLSKAVSWRLQSFFATDQQQITFPVPDKWDDGSSIQHAVLQRLCSEERVIFLLSLAPHIQPNFIDTLVQQYLPKGGDFPEMGGVKGTNHRSMLPTGETALFILAGTDIEMRMHVMDYFSPDHFFFKENILYLEHVKDGEPAMSGKIILQKEYVDLFTTGSVTKPSFGTDFPAKLVSTKMEWDDLILNPKTAESINGIKIWLQHNNHFIREWGMGKKIKPGFRALFHGPSGTGKTLTATLLGKHFQKDVYRIDLSQVVSKYIGETEKNLEKIFNKAENKDWILFFDEADSLFGKRSNVQNAHDKYANQEVSYLLQRVEDFPGLIILASNYKSNIDQAFVRRFNSIIHFPMPNKEERYALWKSSIPSKGLLDPDISLNTIANHYELSGSAIINVMHYASLQTIYKNSTTISKQDIIEGIKREYEKEERVFTG